VMCLAARRAGIESRQLSFTRVLDLVNTAWPKLSAAQTKREHDEYFEQVLDWAAECRLPNRAKRRSYPRAVWGRGGQFPAKKTK
jgi:putative transposase